MADVERLSGFHVTRYDGLTSPGSWGRAAWSCTWFLDSPDVGTPSALVQYEVARPAAVSGLKSYLKQSADLGTSRRIRHLGDVAKIDNHTLNLISGRTVLTVSMILHAAATPDDQQKVIALARFVLTRVPAS